MPAPLVKLERVNVTLNGSPVLHDVSFRLEAGQCWAVLGANGAGKSTFLKLLRGEIWPDPGQGVREYAIVGAEPRPSPIGVRERVAFVSPEMQDRYVRLGLPVTGVEVVRTGFHQTDYLSYPLEAAQLERADAIICELDLEHLREKPVLEMSKGQLRRILLARALVSEPRILMLDECFSGVDPESKGQLMGTVDRAARNGLTVLYTTHRLEETIAATTHALEFQGGRIASSGPTVRFSSGINAFSVSEQRARASRSRSTATNTAAPLLEISDADVYLGDPVDDLTALDGSGKPTKKRILERIHWRVHQGEQWAVVGHNGAGKTTLARLVLGELQPALGGTVKRFGLERMPIWDRQARIGLISSDVQVRHRVDADGFTVVASGFTSSVGWARDLEAHESGRVQALLEALEITHLASRNALATSHGELKKLLIARSLVTHPDLVILDEPFDYLDARSRGLLFDLIEFETARTQFITVAHRLEDIPPSVTHVLHLERGQVRSVGSLEAFLAGNPEMAQGLEQVF